MYFKKNSAEERIWRSVLGDTGVNRKFESNSGTGFSGFTCPSCNNVFGISNDFLYENNELIFVYTCPYCAHKTTLQKTEDIT